MTVDWPAYLQPSARIKETTCLGLNWVASITEIVEDAASEKLVSMPAAAREQSSKVQDLCAFSGCTPEQAQAALDE